MDLQTFFENFDTIAEAPGGIDKLRSLILDLAVRGKLVPCSTSVQHPLKKFLSLQNGYAFKSVWYQSEGIRLVRNQNISHGILDWQDAKYIDTKKAQEYSRFALQEGDIVLSLDRPIISTGLKIARVKKKDLPSLLLQRVARPIISNQSLSAEYLYLWFKSSAFLSAIDPGRSNGVPHISTRAIERLEIQVPALTEQERIVAKVDELMGLCDRLQAAQEKRDRDRQKLRASALDALMNAPTDEALDQSWAFVRDRWDDLNQQPEDVKEMRSLLSNFAIRGKLPTRNALDESSLKLLNRINESRETLVKEKKISTSKKLLPVTDDIFPYELPSSWTWIRLGQVLKKIEYGTSSKASLNKDDVPVFRMGNIQEGEILFEDFKYVPVSIKDLPKLFLDDGDILFNRTNSFELVGKSAVFRGPANQYTFASYLIRLTFFMEYSDPDFFNIVLNSGFFRRTQIEPEITQQCGQANFNGTKLQHTLIPMPPIKEQRRIVEQVGKFKCYCDRLETSLRQSQEKASALASAATANLEI